MGDLFLVGTDGPSDDGLYALEWATGELRWKTSAPSRGIGASGVASDIQVRDGRIYAASLSDEVLCLDLENGNRYWSFRSRFDTPGWVLNGTPAVTERAVFFGGLDGTVYALTRDRGELLWEKRLGESIRTSLLTLHDSLVIVGTPDGWLHALDARSGETQSRLNLGAAPSGAMIEAGGQLLVYTGHRRRTSELLNVSSDLSRIVWARESPVGTSWSTPRPYVYDGRVFVGSSGGHVFEYGLADGKLLGGTQLRGVVRGIRLAGNALYVGSQEGRLYAIKR